MKVKRNWIVLSVRHERYSFDTTLNIYWDRTLQDIMDNELFLPMYEQYKDKIEKVHSDPDDHAYMLDLSSHSEIDTQYTYPGLDANKIQHLHLDVYMFVPLDEFLNEEYQSFVWGNTESKFGILDIKR